MEEYNMSVKQVKWYRADLLLRWLLTRYLQVLVGGPLTCTWPPGMLQWLHSARFYKLFRANACMPLRKNGNETKKRKGPLTPFTSSTRPLLHSPYQGRPQ